MYPCKSKVCVACKDTKLLTEFYPDDVKKDGRSSCCIECHKARCKQYYIEVTKPKRRILKFLVEAVSQVVLV